jgi:hypothetical protein
MGRLPRLAPSKPIKSITLGLGSLWCQPQKKKGGSVAGAALIQFSDNR